MTRIKICGITSIADARLAVGEGADLLGLNFYPGSARVVDVEPARAIADAVRGQVVLVGVFVNAAPDWVEEIAETVGLDLLQFHGDERPEDLQRFGARAIKALRWTGRRDVARLAEYPEVWGFLLDRRHDSLYGGSGEAWDYRSVAGLQCRRPWLLAGGLGPRNVRSAVAEVRPWGVDVASGVESAPGRKDAELLRRFVAEVRNGETLAVP
ncbi:MAG: phosphoribosylanthranilate isomerase [Acidobacteriota bacterium]